MVKEKRKARLNKGEGGGFIGFGAFATPATDVNADASVSTEATGKAVPGNSSGMALSPVYMGSNSELTVVFSRVIQKRDATTKTKALQELRDVFANTEVIKKVQAEALAHFLYLYHTKLHYDNAPRVRSASLECCLQAVQRVPKAWSTLTEQQPEILAMVWCGQADPATDVRVAARQVVEAWKETSINVGMWDYVKRILSYAKPQAMHQELFQKSTDTGKLSDRLEEELDKKYERIVGTAIGGLQLYLQQMSNSVNDSSLLPSPDMDIRFLWKNLSTPKASLRRKTYSLLFTCCQRMPTLIDQDKLSKLLSQNLSSEKELTNVKVLLDTLLAFVASVPPDQRVALLAQYTKPLTKLFAKGCHGATGWAPNVLPIVALLPPDSQPDVLTSVWQGKSNIVGVADQYDLISAVAETSAFLLQKQPHDLAQVFGTCWLQALKAYLQAPKSKGGPVLRAHQALGQTLAKSMQQLDAASSSNSQVAMFHIADWFWETEIPKLLVRTESESNVTHLTFFLQKVPSVDLSPLSTSHLPPLWKKIFHQRLQQCRESVSKLPFEEVYELWLVLLQQMTIQEIFENGGLDIFVMNDILRWLVIHTSSVSDQLDMRFAKYDFEIFRACHRFAPSGSWDTILQELVAAKCDLGALVAGLNVLGAEGIDSVKSTVLDKLCLNVAEEVVHTRDYHEEDSETLSEASDLHPPFDQQAADFLKTCVGLGQLIEPLVDPSIVSSLVDVACPKDPAIQRVANPVLDILVSLATNERLLTTVQVERVILQAWRQGEDSWSLRVLPWLSNRSDMQISLAHSSSRELRSTLKQAISESNMNLNLSHMWSQRAVRLFHLCHPKPALGELPVPSLELIGLADQELWLRVQNARGNFACRSLLAIMESLDNMESRWGLFKNIQTGEPANVLVNILFSISDGSTNLLTADSARRRTDASAKLLAYLGGRSCSEEVRNGWIGSCLSNLSSTFLSNSPEDMICRGISVLSQLVSLNFDTIRPDMTAASNDKLDYNTVLEGSNAWYIADTDNPTSRLPCSIVKIHNDPGHEVYFTIKVERDGVMQERQTIGDRLRSTEGLPNPSFDDSEEQTIAISGISAEEEKSRQILAQSIVDTLTLPTWTMWKKYEFELLHVLISQIGLLGPRGIGSSHYEVFQKLMSLQNAVASALQGTRTLSAEVGENLWKLALSLGFGSNTPSSPWTVSLLGIDPKASIEPILHVLLESDEEWENLTLDSIRAALAWVTVSFAKLDDAGLLDRASSLLFILVTQLLQRATASSNRFGQDDYVALHALEQASFKEQQSSEPECLDILVKSFASRWEATGESHDDSKTPVWLKLSQPTSVLEASLDQRPFLVGSAARKNANELVKALGVESKRFLAYRFLEAYARTEIPIHSEPDHAMNTKTTNTLKEWSKDLILEETVELEEDMSTVCQWVPSELLNAMEDWKSALSETAQINEHDAIGHMMSWLAFLQIVDVAADKDSQNRPAMTSFASKAEAVDAIMNLAIANANIGTDRKVKFEKYAPLTTLMKHEIGTVRVSKISVVTIFRTVEVFPTLAKQWWEMTCPNYYREPVREFVESNVSPEILQRELDRIKVASSFGEMTVKGSAVSREVTALYTQDDFTLSVVIKLPPSFPFQRAEVDCSKTLGVPETRWKRWSLQITRMLNNQGGTLKDALLLWKENVDKEFEGIEPCPVCYSVLHVKTHKLPEMECKTCHNRFHFDCLTQWFKSSGKSACVLCQQPWSGTRVL